METVLYILKRTNGCYGIYKNGKQQENLISNSFLSDRVDLFINRILLECEKLKEHPQIIFTDDELEFQNNLPKIEDLIGGL